MKVLNMSLAAAEAMHLALRDTMICFFERNHKMNYSTSLANTFPYDAVLLDGPQYAGAWCWLKPYEVEPNGDVKIVYVEIRSSDRSWTICGVFVVEPYVLFDVVDCTFRVWYDWEDDVTEICDGHVRYMTILGDTHSAKRWLTYWRMSLPDDDEE